MGLAYGYGLNEGREELVWVGNRWASPAATG